MTAVKKILIAEDNETVAKYYAKLLEKAGYQTTVENNGLAAFNKLKTERYDLVIADWLMPLMDGIELIKKIRSELSYTTFVIMITAKLSGDSKEKAYFSGADEFMQKPIQPEELLEKVQNSLQIVKESFSPIDMDKAKDITVCASLPPFIGVGIAVSTGGPPTVMEIFRSIPARFHSSIMIVQHGPSWMLESFAHRLHEETGHSVVIAKHDTEIEINKIYIAPGDKHMILDPTTLRLQLVDGPKINFVKPAADPLFESIAKTFGSYSLAVVLTGLGRDGARGAAAILSAGGKVLVQDPATAIAPSMPTAVIKSGIKHEKYALTELGAHLSANAYTLSSKLNKEHERLRIV